MIDRLWPALCAGALTMILFGAAPGHAEHNPLRGGPLALGTEADRLIVGFRATPDNVVLQTIHRPGRGPALKTWQAHTRASDLVDLADRVHIPMVRGRQLTPSMHVMQLRRMLYGAEVEAMLAALRSDPAVKFAEVDRRRYPHGLPDDPLFAPSADAGGQWFMLTPSAPGAAGDASATDAVSAWNVTQGSSGTVIADVDTGVLFDHPDLLRAGFGGRLLPGYDFVSEDLNATTGAALGTFLIANDGDGWDPDPTDPGDWINATDQTSALFPSSRCPTADSSWHGTRVMGILGALTNNSVGVAGMTWNPYLLPVRALGKCGGYDSDIITGMQWAAGMSITGVPDNPYPADIINLSLGGAGACLPPYTDVIATLSGMGVLIVASAGNASGPVDAPANCPGVLGVAGLRNPGTKVGYSSFGPELAVGAPAGNCVNAAGLACLKSIDTTTNTGLTTPTAAAYTNEINPNLGTSFSAPIVTGIAALMRAVNANLTPAQLIARIEASASPFPQPAGIPVCPNATATGECACPNDHSQCGYGMVNALSAVMAAQRPIAAVLVPAGTGAGTTVVLDAGGSAAACGRTVSAYAWAASGGVTLVSGQATAQVTVMTSGTGSVTLTVTDSASAADTVVLVVGATGKITAPAGTPASGGTVAGACPGLLTVSPAPPTVTESFSPASVAPNGVSTLIITLANSNGFALTRSALTETLPGNLTLAATSGSALAPATNCSGAGTRLVSTPASVALSNADIPANGSCTITLSVQAATPGTYTNTVAASALTTGPAGANTAGADAVLTVSAPSHGGGGSIDGWDMLLVIGVLLAGRRRPKRRPPL